jgi:hypothetical protein
VRGGGGNLNYSQQQQVAGNQHGQNTQDSRFDLHLSKPSITLPSDFSYAQMPPELCRSTEVAGIAHPLAGCATVFMFT